MNEQRQKEIKELLTKHTAAADRAEAQSQSPPAQMDSGGIAITDVSGDHNNFYINTNITTEIAATAKKN